MPLPSCTAAQGATLLAHLDHPEVRARVDAGWRKRTEPARIRILDRQGRPLPGMVVQAEQTRPAVRFGANAFHMGHWQDGRDGVYEAALRSLCDLAVVSFFWGDYEPEEGRPRFAADAPRRHRRPPPDLVLDRLEHLGIEPKGHCLLWHQILPAWVPRTEPACSEAWRAWFTTIAARYGSRIPTWDAVNEVLLRFTHPEAAYPLDATVWAFAEARRLFPGRRLFLNEAQVHAFYEYAGDEGAFVILLDWLHGRGVRPDGIGLQYHLFEKSPEAILASASRILDGRRIFSALDRYAVWGVPIHISEITVPCWGGAEGESLQAELAERLVRLWVSHPGVESIVWWNLPDGAAYGGEGDLRGGLLREDLSPKPAHERILAVRRALMGSGPATCDRDGWATLPGPAGRWRLSGPGSTTTTVDVVGGAAITWP
jgi:endo-1,4-beta-xylanase